MDRLRTHFGFSTTKVISPIKKFHIIPIKYDINMQYNQNYRYQRRLFLKRFKIGCQSAALEGLANSVKLLGCRKEMNYIYSSYSAPCSLDQPSQCQNDRLYPAYSLLSWGTQEASAKTPVTFCARTRTLKTAQKYAASREKHSLVLFDFREVNLDIGEILLRGRR